MYDEVTIEQILELIEGLIAAGRITVVDNKLFVDDTLVMDSEAANVVELDVPEYDEYGISVASNEHGALRLRDIDDRVAADLSSPDPILVQVAQAFPQFYFINIDRGLSTEDVWLRNCNINKQSFLSAWLKRYLMPAYFWADAKWVNKGTGVTLSFQGLLTEEQHFSGEWEKTPRWDSSLGKLENHLTYSMGVFSTARKHPKYASEYLAKAGIHAIKRYEKMVVLARKRAVWAESGNVRPSVGPRRG